MLRFPLLNFTKKSPRQVFYSSKSNEREWGRNQGHTQEGWKGQGDTNSGLVVPALLCGMSYINGREFILSSHSKVVVSFSGGNQALSWVPGK